LLKDFDFRKYIAIGLKWWWLIMLAPIVTAAGGYGIGYAILPEPEIVYEARVTLMIGPSVLQTNIADIDFSTSQQWARTYADMAQYQPVLQAVIDDLQLNMSWRDLSGKIKVKPVAGTQLLELTANASSPEDAEGIVTGLANQLIRLSPTGQQNQEKEKEQGFVRQRLEKLQTNIEAGQARLEDLQVELNGPLSVEQAKAIQDEISKLETLMVNWEANYGQLLAYLKNETSVGNLSIIEAAKAKPLPIENQLYLYPLIGGAVGLGLALGLIYLVESLDDSIKSKDELSQLFGLFTLGAISEMKGRGYQNKLTTIHDTFSPVSEAYRKIRSNIQFMSIDQPVKSILVTSSNPGEGKSIMAANLAVVMAQAGLKTIIVDADLRRPVLHEIFQIPNRGGVTELLYSPKFEIRSQLRKTSIENLLVLTCGAPPPNPSELLGSQRMGALIANLNEMADVVIYDSPPVLPVTDSVVLSHRVDGVVLAVHAGKTSRNLINQAVSNLHRADANLLGAVLNRVSEKSDSHYFSYYHYYSPNGHKETSLPAQGKSQRWRQRLPFLK
jgi:non-specific protein-tyrosine kinase